jgi:hypothetical protein
MIALVSGTPVIYTHRYFGDCESDASLRDCIIYHTRCLDGNDAIVAPLKRMRKHDSKGDVLFVSCSGSDFDRVTSVFGDKKKFSKRYTGFDEAF